MQLEDRRLHQIAPLRGLGAVARQLDIPLTLFGGVAARVAMQLARKPRRPLDLFDLAPFSSDIDLEFGAEPERASEVLAAIQTHVPFASWFRWSLVDRDRAVIGAAQRAMSTIVPLRTVRFHTDGPAEISDEAAADLKCGRVSFHRNPRFDPGGQPDGPRDVELFGLMMALNAEADFKIVDPRVSGLDEAAAVDWIRSDGVVDLSTILTNDRLLGRFWTLFATRRALAGPGGPVFEELTQAAERAGLFLRLGYDPDDADATFGLSKLSRVGQFRATELAPRVMTGDDARSSFVGVMNDVIGAMGLDRRIAEPEELLDPALDLVAVVPHVSIQPLPDDEVVGAPDVFESGLDDEFIQIAWPHRGRAVSKSGLTGQIFAYGQRRRSGSYSSVPAVGGVQGDRAWIRIRLDDLTDPDEEKMSQSAAVVIMQARHG